MKNVENIDSLTKEEEIERIQEIKSKLLSDDSKIEGIFNSHLKNFDFSKKYSPYELEMKNIKKVLIDLSILLGYDLEPCHEIITAKHFNIRGITYPIFKGCLVDFLEKKELKLSNMFFQEQNSISIGQIQSGNDMVNNTEKIKENISLTDDINLIILHRSLFILKKKFDKFSSEIKKIYNKYSEPIENEIDYLVDTNNVKKITEEICSLTEFEIAKCDSFKKAIFKENNYFKKCEIEKEVLNQFLNYVAVNRRKYNFIFREKRNKKFFKMEDYENYIPQGDDDLTRKFVETLKEDDESEIIPNKDKDNKSELILLDGTNKLGFNQNENEDNLEEKQEDEKKNENKEKEVKLNESNIDKSKLSNVISKNDSNIEEEEEENDDYNSKLKIESMIKKNKPKKLRKLSLKSEIQTGNIKTVIYTKSYLYIETLPLMIADFISTEPTLLILDHSDDLRDNLRTLFDNEVMGRLGEETYTKIAQFKAEQLKELLLNLAKIEKNLETYQDLYTKMKNANQNVKFIINTIEKLTDIKQWLNRKIKSIQDDTNTYNEYEQTLKKSPLKTINETKISSEISERNKSIILQNNIKQDNINKFNIDDKNLFNEENQNDISQISLPKIDKSHISSQYSSIYSKSKNKKIISKEEKRDLAIKEIFFFYSRQHAFVGYKSTFDILKDKMEHMDLSEFYKFCSEFKILVSREKLIEIFKKSASNTKEMSLDNFKESLQKISVATNDEKIKVIKKRILKKTKQLNDSEQKDNISQKKTMSEKQSKISGKKNTTGENESQMSKKENINSEKQSKISKSNNNNEDNNENNNEDNKDNNNEENNENNNEENNENNNEKNNENNNEENNENNNEENNENKEENESNIKDKSKIGTEKVSMLKKDQLQGEIYQYQNEINALKSKKNQELLEELYLYLEIDDENEYRKKMKGFNLPFYNGSGQKGIVKLPLIKFDKKTNKINLKDELENKEIKEMINQRKENKIKNKKQLIKLTGMDRERQKINLEKTNINIQKNYSSSRRPIFLSERDKQELLKSENRYRKFEENKSPDSVSRFVIVKENNNEDNLNFTNIPKRENKYNWESIENMKSNNFIKDEDLLKIING